MLSFISKFWERWKEWGLPAFISALSPLFTYFVNLQLISSFYQPALGLVATVLGALAAMVSVATLMERSKAIRVPCLLIAICVLVATFVICLIFSATVGQTWFLDKIGRTVVHVIWRVAYICVFVSFGVATATAYLLIFQKRIRRSA
jgi:hypothetical protein